MARVRSSHSFRHRPQPTTPCWRARPAARSQLRCERGKRKFPAGLGAKQAVAAVADAFEQARDASGTSQARGKLRDLIGQIGDSSNLILDNVLETYYLTDVVLNRLPEVMDRVADLGSSRASANDAQSRANFLVAAGALRSAVDGMDASLTAAEHDNADQSIARALRDANQPLHQALSRFVDGISGGADESAAAPGLVADIARFDDSGITELRQLLQRRVAALSWSQRVHVAVSGLAYLASLLLVLWMMRRGVSQPIARLTAVTTRLAGGELTAEVPDVASGGEIAALAAALNVFKQSMLETERLTAQHAAMRQQADAEKRAALLDMAEKIETESMSVMESVGARTTAIAASADEMGGSASRTHDPRMLRKTRRPRR